MKMIKEKRKLDWSSLFKGMRKFDWYSLIFALILSAAVWSLDISVETQYIPEIFNSVVTATSLFVGLTGTLLVISMPSAAQHKLRISLGIVLLTVPIMALFFPYYDIVRGFFQGSLKWALTSLVLSFVLIQNFAQFLSNLWIEQSAH
jgi:hypothetical protein